MKRFIKVNNDFRITIPKEVRRLLKIRKGQSVKVVTMDNDFRKLPLAQVIS